MTLTIPMALSISPLNALREQLPERLRDRYAFKIQTDAYGLRCMVIFKHMKTDQVHEITLEPGMRIPAAALALLCLSD